PRSGLETRRAPPRTRLCYIARRRAPSQTLGRSRRTTVLITVRRTTCGGSFASPSIMARGASPVEQGGGHAAGARFSRPHALASADSVSSFLTVGEQPG